MEENLYQMISQAQKDSATMENLVYKFDPLIKKYAQKLAYEDADLDIIANFIEKIQELESQKLYARDNYTLLSYIKKIVYSIYCNLLYKYLKRVEEISFSIQEDNLYQDMNQYAVQDEYPIILTDLLDHVLTPHQAQIMKYIIFDDYSIKEIAQIYGTTPEAVTISKGAALKKLRNWYSDNV